MIFVDQDVSMRLVEWLEVLRQQGYDTVFVYVVHVHPNVLKVLR